MNYAYGSVWKIPNGDVFCHSGVQEADDDAKELSISGIQEEIETKFPGSSLLAYTAAYRVETLDGAKALATALFIILQARIRKGQITQ